MPRTWGRGCRLDAASAGVPISIGGLAAVFVLTEDGLVKLSAMHGDVFGGIDAETHFSALHLHNGHLDVVTNHDRLIALTG